MSFNTVKSKIILISALMLITLSILFGFFAYIYMQNGKSLLLKGFSFHISNFAEKINKDIMLVLQETQMSTSQEFFAENPSLQDAVPISWAKTTFVRLIADNFLLSKKSGSGLHTIISTISLLLL